MGDRVLFLATLLALGAAIGVRIADAEPSAPLRYVALGDSTVSGVGAGAPEHSYPILLHARLQAVRPAATVTNLGVGGATAADVRREQLPRALALRPDLVSLSVGPNDITTRRDPRQYARALDVILSRLARESRAILVVNLIPDLALTPRFRRSEKGAVVARQTVRFNQALRQLARRYRAEVIDLYALSRAEVPRHPELIAEDGSHPSDAGYARWAEAMWQGIRPRIASK